MFSSRPQSQYFRHTNNINHPLRVDRLSPIMSSSFIFPDNHLPGGSSSRDAFFSRQNDAHLPPEPDRRLDPRIDPRLDPGYLSRYDLPLDPPSSPLRSVSNRASSLSALLVDTIANEFGIGDGDNELQTRLHGFAEVGDYIFLALH